MGKIRVNLQVASLYNNCCKRKKVPKLIFGNLILRKGAVYIFNVKVCMVFFGFNLFMAGVNLDGRTDLLILNLLSAAIFFYATLKFIPRSEPPTTKKACP